MSEKDSIKNAMQRIEGHLKSGASGAEAALKELGALQQLGIHDARVMVFQAIAMNHIGKKKEALDFANNALTISKNIQQEAEALIQKLK